MLGRFPSQMYRKAAQLAHFLKRVCHVSARSRPDSRSLPTLALSPPDHNRGNRLAPPPNPHTDHSHRHALASPLTPRSLTSSPALLLLLLLAGGRRDRLHKLANATNAIVFDSYPDCTDCFSKELLHCKCRTIFLCSPVLWVADPSELR